MSATRNNNKSSSSAPTLSVHDPEFKNLITVPLAAVHHLPPAHLEISRLVLCRKYDPADAANSCPMGDSCKFVHIDMSTPQLKIQSIHVNYMYRTPEDCMHQRLPAGEQLSVLSPNNRSPSQIVPSELVIVTKGALNRHCNHTPLSHCAHYYYNRMCSRGERCSFLHCLYIDATAADFQRAPPRAGAGHSSASKSNSQKHHTKASQQRQQDSADAPASVETSPATRSFAMLNVSTPRTFASSFSSNPMTADDNTIESSAQIGKSTSTDDLTDLTTSPRSSGQSEPPAVSSRVLYCYRRNPYSCEQHTVEVV